MREVAALMCYNLCLKEDSVKMEDQFRYVYNAYHRNADQNVVSKVEILVNGNAVYKYLNDRAPLSIVMNRYKRSHNNDKVDERGEILKLHRQYALGERYV